MLLYRLNARYCTVRGMDVAVTELRAHLSHWLGRVRNGDEVVVTDRGVPVARIVGLDGSSIVETLHEQGVIARPERPDRPTATGRLRPQPRRSVSDRVGEQRR